ncbi:MAG: glycosyltransferase family 2 protein [Lachnospiraceae bacterium]|nr:glycosyltransferase family 2 protein [Lachnospiraceae bacterium]
MDSETNFFEINSRIKSELIFGGKNPDPPILSIVIPTYKRIDLLRKNLRAILSQIQPQSFFYEVVIVSNDPDFDPALLELELDPRVFKVYVNQSNLGMCGNMNRCATLAAGEYIAYIQDDDVLLPDYLEEIRTLHQSGELSRIDCLIPNRYFYMENNDSTSKFGKKAIRNMKRKWALCHALRLGKDFERFQRIRTYDTLVTAYQYYAGGPTCGMLFRRESLLRSGGFDPSYPYGFDYVFFVNFMENYNVYLYDKFLSVYMTSNSASNRPEVQYDFFRARYDCLLEGAARCEKLQRQKDVILCGTYHRYPAAVQKLIAEKYRIPAVPKMKYKLYFLLAQVYTYRSGGYRRQTCPPKICEWYLSL